MINSGSHLKVAVDPEVPGSSLATDGRDVGRTGRLDGEVLNSGSALRGSTTGVDCLRVRSRLMSGRLNKIGGGANSSRWVTLRRRSQPGGSVGIERLGSPTGRLSVRARLSTRSHAPSAGRGRPQFSILDILMEHPSMTRLRGFVQRLESPERVSASSAMR